MTKLRILLLSHVRPGHAGTSHDHEWALAEFSRHHVYVHSPLEQRIWHPPLTEFDVIIIHYSLMTWSEAYLPQIYHEAIAQFRGLKAMFIQDEYREVFSAMDMMERLGVDLLFTCIPPANIDAAYGELRRRGVRIEPTLTGYVPISFDESAVVPMSARTYDVIYRAREVPFALGKLAQEKFEIAQSFVSHARKTDLRCDISCREQDRIYADDWFRFVASSRTSLGTESGASIMDFTGEIDRAVKARQREAPGLTFESIHDELLKPYEGNVIINAISPRAFEAIYLRNVLVLYPGEYSRILRPDRHYIVLQKDFSNFQEVVDQIRDVQHLEDIAERAYAEIVASGDYSYATFAKSIDLVLENEWVRRVQRPEIAGPARSRSSGPRRSALATTEAWRNYLRSLGHPGGKPVLTNYNAQRLALGAATVHTPIAAGDSLPAASLHTQPQNEELSTHADELLNLPESTALNYTLSHNSEALAIPTHSSTQIDSAIELVEVDTRSAELHAASELSWPPPNSADTCDLPVEELVTKSVIVRGMIYAAGTLASLVFRRRLRMRFELFPAGTKQSIDARTPRSS